MALSYFFKIELSLTFLSASREKISLWLRFQLWTQKENAKEGTAKHSDSLQGDTSGILTVLIQKFGEWNNSELVLIWMAVITKKIQHRCTLCSCSLCPSWLQGLSCNFFFANTPSLAFETGLCIQSIHDLVSLLLKMSLCSIYHRRKWRKQDDKAVKDGQDDPICTWDCSTVHLMQIEGLFLNYGNQT